jgi:chromosome segregation ATPase
MVDNPAKREEARRVWRLNKKEGIPVLEALETADISKDTYYQYKSEYESEWEGEIHTAEEVERELERLRGEISDLMEKADDIGDRFGEIEEKFDSIDDQLAAERTAEQLWELHDDVEFLEHRIQELEGAETQKSWIDRDGTRQPVDLQNMREEVDMLLRNQEATNKKIEKIEEEKVGEEEWRRLKRKVRSIKEEIDSVPRSLSGLLFG